ncbi:hypothetical protein RSO41_11745 [Halomonas sp. I1]|uniref:hypothetical protein n=1 Tax=Halomonas sp. I1 TaxID=393536 RepID=UPI0028DFC616|nr:hypothetical protein [Halomonas sp. I1]MDT8895327.1 hypothetical protein [Halomonas sp. I1]
MKLRNDELTRQDDELTVSDSPKEVNQFRFGFWPEVAGLVASGIIIWIMQL